MIQPLLVLNLRFRQYVRKQIWIKALIAMLSLLAGAALLAATWAVIYLVSLFTLKDWLDYKHWFHLVAGLIMIPALFWGNARTCRRYLFDNSVTTGTATDTIVIIPGKGSNVNPLAPDTMHTIVKMITDCLYCAPRVVVSGFQTLCRANRLRKLDFEACGRVLSALLTANGTMAFQEIVQKVDGIDPVRVFPQLHDIDEVVGLPSLRPRRIEPHTRTKASTTP